MHRALTGAACCAAAALALAATTASAPASAVTYSCGGLYTDYVGALVLDTPFVGTAVLDGVSRAMTVAPVKVNDNMLSVEIVTAGQSRQTTADFEVRTDTTGRGQIFFSSYSGEGVSTNLICASGTRVTSITGMVATQDGPAEFTVTRT
ncbi:hypothetical protein TR51_00085 [Kitasatospora griseola]|uniref:Lipoprotein n=1 Tax=Kitasatospora griseola TaxID=2064 RepID=A0A0D0Q567_KITGR|nr:hypothetical protein [Kitasatospora griseola]KIQ66148.1 hypothetical protein TR51_00085 [Kitasatospora griseola]